MKNLCILCLGILFSCATPESIIDSEPISYGEVILNGTFQGANLYVQNPFSENGFCALSVFVNDSLYIDSAQLQVNAFEIDLIRFGLIINDPVTIKIKHKGDCIPKVLNSTVR